MCAGSCICVCRVCTRTMYDIACRCVVCTCIGECVHAHVYMCECTCVCECMQMSFNGFIETRSLAEALKVIKKLL